MLQRVSGRSLPNTPAHSGQPWSLSNILEKHTTRRTETRSTAFRATVHFSVPRERHYVVPPVPGDTMGQSLETSLSIFHALEKHTTARSRETETRATAVVRFVVHP